MRVVWVYNLIIMNPLTIDFVVSNPGTQVAQNLMQQIKMKCSPGEAVELLRDCPNPDHDNLGKLIF